jgi:iron complex outermembrane recepter protein
MRYGFKARLLGASAAAVVCGAAGGAWAQDAETQVEDVIVTAQLRAQDPVEVPFALTAYSGEFLQDLGIQEFDQLSNFVPGFLVQNQSPNNPGFVMRGITSDSGEATQEPRVSVFQDGVSISKSRGSYVELFDLERVEIAKGPQSTLYGRGALIGAVNLIQNKPDLGVFEGYVAAEAGNFDYQAFEGVANLPLGDTLAVRLAARLKTRDGYVENLVVGPDYNSIDTDALRLSLGREPTADFRYDVIANWQHDEASGTSFKSRQYFPADPATGQVLGGREPWEGAALTARAFFDGGQELGLDRDVWGITGIGRWELSDSLTLTSTTAYREFDNYETFDADGISLPLLTAAEDTHGEQSSQELRLNWDDGGRVSGFVGGGYFHETGFQRVPLQFDERVALAQVAGVLDGSFATQGNNTLGLPAYTAGPLPTGVLTALGIPAPFIPGIIANLKPAHIEEATNSSELTSYDVFGDLTFRLTDQIELSGGVRYTADEKTSGFTSEVVNGRSVLGAILAIQRGLVPAAQLPAFLTALATPGVVNFPATALPQFALLAQPTSNNGDLYTADLDDDGLTWRATARYAVSEDASVYANYARGRRPAVLSASGPAAPGGVATFSEVEAETVDSYEIGAKAAAMGRALRLDGALFYQTYENFQTTVLRNGRYVNENAGEATAWGIESQAFWAAGSKLDLFATYAYNHNRFETGARDGNRFRLSPDHRASIGLNWRLPVLGGAFEVQPSYTYQTIVFFDNDNDRQNLQTVATGALVADTVQDEFQDGYGLLNLRVRYAPNAGAWEVEAFGENILDEEYIKDAGNTGDTLGLPTFVAGRPATYGARLTLRY